MKKWLAIIALPVALLVGYVAAGPFIAYSGIRTAIEEQDTPALERYVDFPALRANLRARIEDDLARRAGPEMQSSLLGALAVKAASGLAGGAVDAMVRPAGIAALLEGRQAWDFARTGGVGRSDTVPGTQPGPLQEPDFGFESFSRFTATVEPAAGSPVTLVLSRQGLRWRLTDIIPARAQDASGQGR